MNAPLTDTEYDSLGNVLSRFRSQRGMNLENLDGFFAALICCPDTVLPSEYLPQIWGGDMVDEDAFSTQQELQDFLNLVMRHWNGITHTLHSGDVFLPLLLENEQGVAHANDWAQGFMRGVALRNEDWLKLFDDEEHGGSLVPILALAHEHHPDPEMRPYDAPIDAERREQLIVCIAAAVPAIYRYFEPHRRLAGRFGQGKIGRNDLCRCGSGKKYKHCCGKTTP